MPLRRWPDQSSAPRTVWVNELRAPRSWIEPTASTSPSRSAGDIDGRARGMYPEPRNPGRSSHAAQSPGAGDPGDAERVQRLPERGAVWAARRGAGISELLHYVGYPCGLYFLVREERESSM